MSKGAKRLKPIETFLLCMELAIIQKCLGRTIHLVYFKEKFNSVVSSRSGRYREFTEERQNVKKLFHKTPYHCTKEVDQLVECTPDIIIRHRCFLASSYLEVKRTASEIVSVKQQYISTKQTSQKISAS